MKKMKLCICVLAILALLGAGIGCYYWYAKMHPDAEQGGILVYEHHTVYPDQQEC